MEEAGRLPEVTTMSTHDATRAPAVKGRLATLSVPGLFLVGLAAACSFTSHGQGGVALEGGDIADGGSPVIELSDASASSLRQMYAPLDQYLADR